MIIIALIVLHFLSGIFVAWRLTCYGFLSKQKNFTNEDIYVAFILIPLSGFMSLAIALSFGDFMLGFKCLRAVPHKNLVYKETTKK